MNRPLIHPLADVQSTHVGMGTQIAQFVAVSDGARIGADCKIAPHCFIEAGTVVGNRATICSGVQIPNGLRVGDDVFIGTNVSFAQGELATDSSESGSLSKTTVESGAAIGTGAVIYAGVTIGRNAQIIAGAVVTRSVPPNAVVVGNPAHIVGYVGAVATQKTSVSTKKNDERITETRVNGVALYQMPRIADMRGSLSVGEFEDTVPFAVKRYFLVFDVPSLETRGEHAHRECHQFLICVRGSCSVVADDGQQRQEFQLDRPDLGLHLPPMVWGIQYKYSADAIVLVFASHHYDNADYIRDYSEFTQLVAGTK